MKQYEITAANIEPVKQICECCGNTYFVRPFFEQPLCDKCYPFVVKRFFSGRYDNLTVEDFKTTMRKEVMGEK